ncbi:MULTISPECIES: exonuclease SbcCD subunit D [Acidiplasma]|uniref:DNA double-strand break repair protein Mre11 n=1 Tax=Acidiplasma cupricumulans TaxID=312540 RepID=A0A0Q0RGQ4_9ARCH|nr:MULTISPECIES: exonuclease SbcCD subunit D [Acidiplasma]KJE49634.1 DNA repair protein [Acidiplasma sp. MBA-1]KQB34331.1 DNA repair protein [Acidiplasma cupricumulans]WMT55815.1 MAG: exonuclease SbcCD subunit D [Acidiplasma sp.]
MATFLHLSDTHLGYKEYMMDERENDFYESFNEAIDIGLNEHVDFFVHTGDLFDTWSPSNRALNEFKKAALKLYNNGKIMYLIMGDHDRPKRTDEIASRIFDFLGVKLLGINSIENIKVNYSGEDILISGLSNMKGLRKNFIEEEYKKGNVAAGEYKNSILMSHQGVYPYFISEACEVDSSQLPQNYKYLAFGHIHDSNLIDDRYPVFSYAGSTDLNSTSEIKHYLKYKKSVNLVEITSGNVSVQQIKLKSTRYQNIIDSDFINFQNDLKSIVNQKRDNDKKPLITLTIHGSGDRDLVRKQIKAINDIIVRGPLFEKEIKKIVEKPNMNKLLDYFNAYFNDKNTAELADKIFETIKNEDVDSAYKLIKDIMGIGNDN